MRNSRYDFSSVHIDVPHDLAEEIINWGKKIVPDDELFISQKDPGFGRETELHITILYGIHSSQPNQTSPLLQNQPPIKVKLAKVGIFTNPFSFDVLMIEVFSPDLLKLNKLLTENIMYTEKYGSYHPHITLAYVKKGKGWKHNYNELWKDVEFECNSAIFSSTNGFKEKIFMKLP